jgi:hypothetical protein
MERIYSIEMPLIGLIFEARISTLLFLVYSIPLFYIIIAFSIFSMNEDFFPFNIDADESYL